VLVQLNRWGPAGLASGVDLEQLKKTLENGARLMKVPEESIVVLTLTSDAHIKEYNRRYRGLDEPTDVLAFAASEKPTDQRFVPPPGT
jgi:probable rRNA maturation factor